MLAEKLARKDARDMVKARRFKDTLMSLAEEVAPQYNRMPKELRCPLFIVGFVIYNADPILGRWGR